MQTPDLRVFLPPKEKATGAAVVICVAVALGMGAIGTWGPGDQLALVGLGALIAGFLWRYASIRAVPTAEGLVVRNLMLTRRLGWDEIVAVRFRDGDPWVSLDLDDTDVLAVMAIQRVDAGRGSVPRAPGGQRVRGGRAGDPAAGSVGGG